ncbi:uncharacterized protein NECHADRAFT_93398 [Fusarium vanettenii 77-13-4]|uniref:AGC-kinase C-terminal domain-containing protein n=1 Tax=Fusarium vanettenii (strain ATCC MYA-4622 / CBS 123669 / FGSC 9596 / NRRL 45880 / 77-13-4) TaxID=660122 RepID=C7Z195_FUSV7|nr:uncharacterized protein NECHADRAFT_93398 [Fusarium vanettenii 77-13-4]EEU42324.1 hypothetical protein NECHADRAFT_93398 [Fusarium vanettenii 77-13-4]
MLSHLRFHRRGPSNPASPSPDQHTTSPPAGHSAPFPSDVLSPDLRPTLSSPSGLPPTLPPIARVTSDELDQSRHHQQNASMASQVESRPHQTPKSPFNGGTGFIGGVALRNYQRDMEAQAAEAMDGGRGLGLVDQYSASQPTLAANVPPSTRPPPQVLKNTKAASSFSTPTEFQNSAPVPTGRRPAGTRLVTDLPSLVHSTSNTENPKPRKGLPFLKNPMSTLLMRRKNSQHAPDLLPLPMAKQKEEPMYDPRIKGTRIHDFSAPRPKKNAPTKDPSQASFTSPVPGSAVPPEQERFPNSPVVQPEQAPVSTSTQRIPSNASESVYSQDSKLVNNTPSTISKGTHDPIPETSASPGPEAPPVPPKDEGPISVQPRSPQASRLIESNASIYARSTASVRVGRSRGPSLSGLSGKDIPSAVPRHMKSTSSRFSFDMIGAAKQEKLLEDRHRQRELEKKTSEPSGPRDSRFDDFDDDAFDYDAMMDDDGLEERIPGVNADYEDDIYEEEIPMVGEDLDDNLEDNLDDPDNDQENFSGFVFQRSNPTSSLTSPLSAGFIPTPRDTDGNRIGFATSQYTPNMPEGLSPNLPINPQAMQQMQPGGLGIQGLDVPRVPSLENEAAFQKNQDLPPMNMGRSLNDDDLYFDNGMLGFENEFAEDLAAPPEWDDTPFDESIFDNNDTDQFGRPIAGAFAQAQSERRAAKEDDTKRESDMTTRFSAHSAASQSTAHTSLSVEVKNGTETMALKDSSESNSPAEPSAAGQEAPSDGTMAAYQAALAAAAHKAAASGKFQRSSSPPLQDTPLSEPSHSPDTPDRGESFKEDLDGIDDYDDYGQSYEDLADFELDDDAIIAEANASALANDCDGWYGQEFGFYSAPTNSHHGSETVDYEYANGGFFGPKGGLDRSTSGRMVSREPNLTPITERSEYSNRNSIMSLSMPGFGGGTPLQSPGLAQLALLGDRGDEMSLSALLRLRSRAWGGSQASLASSQNGSPRSERGDLSSSPWGPNFSSPPAFHARKNSVLSTISHDSDSVSFSGSPTLTGGIPGLGLGSPPPPVPPLSPLESDMREDAKIAPLNVSRPTSKVYESGISLSPISDPEESMPPSAMVSPLEPSNNVSIPEPGDTPQRPSIGHRHKGSADSISYIQEQDSGATRWVMERRRTGEFGQVEVLEREVVEGGRI